MNPDSLFLVHVCDHDSDFVMLKKSTFEQRSSSVATTHLHPGVGDMLVQFIMIQHHESITRVVKLSAHKQEARNNRFGRCSAWKSVR